MIFDHVECLSDVSFCVESTDMAKLLEFAEAQSRAIPGSGENLLIAHILLEKVMKNSGYLSLESVCKHSGLVLSASALGKEAGQKGDVDAVLSKSCQLLSKTLGCQVAPAVATALLQAIENYAWALDGEALLSPLAHLLQLVAQSPPRLHALTAQQRVSAALLTVGPLVHQLQTHSADTPGCAGGGSANRDSIDDGGPVEPMSVERAQRTQPLVLEGLLTAADVAALRKHVLDCATPTQHSNAPSASYSKGGRGWSTHVSLSGE